MKFYEVVLCIIGISFCHYGYIKAYSLLFKNEICNINIKTIVVILIITILTYYNTFYNYDFSKIIISFIELNIIFRIMFKDTFKNLIIKSLLVYLLGFIIEMILGMFTAYFFINAVQQFDNNILIKVLFSILIMIIMILISKINFIRKLWNKVYSLMNKIFNINILIIFSIFILVLLTYYLIISTDIYSIGSIVTLIAILLSLILIAINQNIKTKKAIDEQEILLNFMKEYEMIIDKERIDRHEMVNNLLALKSIKNKNSKNYEKVLDEILLTYQSNKTPSGLYELPTGLKGLFYYKIYDMKKENIEVFINISNKIITDLDRLGTKNLTKICKILGILLDNAKEAARESKDKLVVIDLYKEKGNIIIYIENSIDNNKIDLKSINNKGFSTKGSNRGYGLYIVNKILDNSKRISLYQNINEFNKFISILTIKNN